MKKYYITIILSCILVSSNLCSQEQLWKHQIGLDAGIALPFAKYTDVYKLKTGYGFSGTYYFQFSENRNLFFSASVGYYSFEGDYWTLPGYSNLLNIIPLQLGFRYNFKLTGLQPYLGFETGIFIMNSESGNDFGTKEKSREYSFGITPKFGFRYPIMTSLDLDASMKIMYVFYKEIGRYEHYNHGQLGFNIGIAYTIGN
jgi:hypothetical protein